MDGNNNRTDIIPSTMSITLDIDTTNTDDIPRKLDN